MRDLDPLSTDPADYISGPTGGQSRSNGGTNRSGGVSISEADTAPADESAPADQTAQPPAAPAQ